MTTPTFTWSPRTEITGTVTLRTRDVQFGDGYSQAVSDGLNNKVQSWPVTFVGKDSYITPIIEFIDALKGYQSFLWTPPLGVEGFYRCKGYSVQPLGAQFTSLSAVFEQVFYA